MLDAIKQLLRKNKFITEFYGLWKARLQEKKALSDLDFYRRIAVEKKLKLPQNGDICGALRERLKNNAKKPAIKPKGEMHIFLAFPLNNWEAILPVALAPFGKITVFKWKSVGLFNNRSEWLRYRELLNLQMIKKFEEAFNIQPIDAVVGYFSDFYIIPETLYKMSESKAIIFNMCWDDKLYFSGFYKKQARGIGSIVAAIDLNLTNSYDSLIKYFASGGLAMFWPEGAHPQSHSPVDVPFKYDVSFVGQRYGLRGRFIEKLRGNEIDIITFGLGWENGTLLDKEMVRLYSESRINLGFAGIGYSSKLMCLKGRDFEIPMSGGLYLTQDNPELSRVYEVGKEIVTHKDINDCVNKIRWLLNNPAVADKIRKAGRERALRDHTWEKRFEEIFRLSGLLKNGH